jgi:hypothetical protein
MNATADETYPPGGGPPGSRLAPFWLDIKECEGSDWSAAQRAFQRGAERETRLLHEWWGRVEP